MNRGRRGVHGPGADMARSAGEHLASSVRLAASRPAVGRLLLHPTLLSGYRRFQRTGTTAMTSFRAMGLLFGNADPSLFDSMAADGCAAPLPLDDASAGVAGEVERVAARTSGRGQTSGMMPTGPDRPVGHG